MTLGLGIVLDGLSVSNRFLLTAPMMEFSEQLRRSGIRPELRWAPREGERRPRRLQWRVVDPSVASRPGTFLKEALVEGGRRNEAKRLRRSSLDLGFSWLSRVSLLFSSEPRGSEERVYGRLGSLLSRLCSCDRDARSLSVVHHVQCWFSRVQDGQTKRSFILAKVSKYSVHVIL